MRKMQFYFLMECFLHKSILINILRINVLRKDY